ncbi:MAG: hypothetical protein EOM03_07840 [Clostridia bacterium]|nr:hypothetical protein [Clostridia bacterium]
MNLLDLFVKVAYDDKDVDKGIEGTSKKGSGFAKNLSKAFGGAAKVVGAISTAAIALGTAFVKSASDTAAYGDEIDKMSQKIGLSTEGYQKWRYVLGQSGGDINNLQVGMKTLASAAYDGSEAFEAIGISLEDAQSLSTEDLFEKTITQLASMEAGTERTALATDLFGRSATDIMPMLNGGAESIEALKKQAEDYGLIMSQDAVNASVKFRDSVSLMQQTLTGMKNRMMSEFLPSLTEVTDGLALLFTGDMSGLDSINSGISNFVDKISEAIPQIVEVAGSLLQTFATAIMDNLPLLVETAFNLVSELGMFILENLPMLVETALEILVSLATGIAEQLPTLIPTIVEVINTIIDTLIENIPMLIEASIQLLMGLADGIITSLPVLAERVPEIVLALINAIVENLPLLLTSGVDIMVAIANAVITAIPTIITAIPEILMAVVQAFADLAPQVWEAGTNLVAGIWEGISNGTQWIYDKISGWVGGVIDWIKGLFGIASPSKEMADGVGRYISEGVGEGITDNINAVTDAAGKLSEAVVAESEQMSQSGSAIVDALGQGMLTRMVGLGQQLVSWFNTAITTPMKTLYKTMYETGRWMMMGFIIGMLSRKAEIISDAIMLAKAATDAFRDNMRISSPSKVMYGFGEYFIMGFTNAISDGIADVRSAVGEMSGAALSFGSDVTQGTTQGQTRTGNTIGGMTFNFNQPVTSPTQTANRISRELAGVLYA